MCQICEGVAKFGVSFLASKAPSVLQKILNVESLTKEQAFELIELASNFFLVDCSCRSREGYGQCGYPIKACLYLDMTLGREGEKISKERAKELTSELSQMGLKVQLMRYPGNKLVICH